MARAAAEIVDPARGAYAWLERIRDFAPMAATLFGILYALGFVIVNAYLGSYGIRELDALRTRYVGAGLLFLVFVGLSLALARQIFLMRQRAHTARALSIVLVAFVLGPVLLSLVEATVLWRASAGAFGLAGLSAPEVTRLVGIFAFANWSLVFGSLLFEGARLRSVGLTSRPILRVLDRPLASAPATGVTTWLLVLIVVGVSLAWSELVYPSIPPYLGGGRPEAVRLVTTQSVADACPPCVSRDVLLLDADDKRIVVVATGSDGRQFAVELFLISGNDRAVIHAPR